ncbi:MAG: Lrp/AsnC family transcriptional regulator [Promethearchaeota archaeon]
MPTAFVLVNAEIGAEDSVLKDLTNTDGVVEAYIVYGVYDIICKIEKDTMEVLKDVITSKIRALDNVRSTLTMIVVEGTQV